MSLHNGIDLVAIATSGTYTETYGSTEPANIANLYVSFGFLEDAPDVSFQEMLRSYLLLLGVG
jgi:hypothetical protein